MTTLSKSLLPKRTGGLATDGVSAEFIGRTFTRQGDVIYVKNSDKYLNDMLSTYNLKTCKAATTTGMSSNSSKLQQCDDPLDSAEHTQYRSTVGKLMWLIAIRYDIFYAVKELSRNLTAPTQLDLTKLERLLSIFVAHFRLSLCCVHRFSLHLVLHLISTRSLTQIGQDVKRHAKALQELLFRSWDVLSLHYHALSKL